VSFEADVVGLLPKLRRYARALTRNPAWADDLVQDTAERPFAARCARWRTNPRNFPTLQESSI
jgi:RNA polymerase sigma-70 factor (ECF subfamily)